MATINTRNSESFNKMSGRRRDGEWERSEKNKSQRCGRWGGEERGKKESKKGVSRFVLYVDQIIIVCSGDTPTLLQNSF